MTWLKGTSTLGAIPGLITQLACGEVADGVGTTCAVGDQWVRENMGQDTMRTPSSVDYTPPVWRMRTGYFHLFQVPGQTNGLGINAGGLNRFTASGSGAVCKVTGPFTTNPTTTHNRWVVLIRSSQANTVPGNYSTAQITYWYIDPDALTFPVNGFLATLNASGTATLSNGVQVNVTDPSGTLPSGLGWMRGFSSVYTYGVEWLPFWPRRGSGVTAPTWTIAPPGVAGTDYDVIDQVSSAFQFPSGSGANSFCYESLHSGLGIKTATGLGSGALYTGTYPIALAKCRIYLTANNGAYAVDPGPSPLDSVNGSVNRPSTCMSIGAATTPNMSAWLRCVQTPSSASSSTAVQYFLSVKATGIFIVLNADPAGTGVLGTAYIGTFTPNDPTNDPLPLMWSQGNNAQSAGSAAAAGIVHFAMPYWITRRMLDTSVAAWSGTATGSSATTLTDSSAARATNQDVGYTIFAGSSSAVVTSNTATTWTVSSWTGGTPSPTAAYTVQRDWQTGFTRMDYSGQYTLSGGSDFNGAQTYYHGQVLFSPDSSTNANNKDFTAIPSGQSKPSTWDGNWWLWGWNLVDAPIQNGVLTNCQQAFSSNGSPNEDLWYRGYQNTRYFYIPQTGFGNGDELTDTNTGEKFLLLSTTSGNAYFGAGYQTTTGSFIGGVAVAEL